MWLNPEVRSCVDIRYENDDIPMYEPGTRIVCYPPYHHLLSIATSTDHVTTNRIDVIEALVTGALHNVKGMLTSEHVSTSQVSRHDRLTP